MEERILHLSTMGAWLMASGSLGSRWEVLMPYSCWQERPVTMSWRRGSPGFVAAAVCHGMFILLTWEWGKEEQAWFRYHRPSCLSTHFLYISLNRCFFIGYFALGPFLGALNCCLSFTEKQVSRASAVMQEVDLSIWFGDERYLISERYLCICRMARRFKWFIFFVTTVQSHFLICRLKAYI